jgi:LysR family transcriptional regulator, flagellar master operon regulator
MDSDLIRTFLEVNRARHFARAAERLFVTPAAVSARVRLLEEQLGTRLFTRSRNNIQLTAAGQRLLPHAENILRSWNRATLSVGTTGDHRELVALGSLHSIWNVLLNGWVPRLYSTRGDLLLQLELQTSLILVTRVREQSLDLALVYEPPQVSDLAAEVVGAVELILVAHQPGLEAGSKLNGYVSVDWGTPFAMTLSRALPVIPDPILRVDAPEVAHEFLRRCGGAAYLPSWSVRDDVQAGLLHPVLNAPVIERQVYLIQSANAPQSQAQLSVRDDLLAWMAERSLVASSGTT